MIYSCFANQSRDLPAKFLTAFNGKKTFLYSLSLALAIFCKTADGQHLRLSESSPFQNRFQYVALLQSNPLPLLLILLIEQSIQLLPLPAFSQFGNSHSYFRRHASCLSSSDRQQKPSKSSSPKKTSRLTTNGKEDNGNGGPANPNHTLSAISCPLCNDKPCKFYRYLEAELTEGTTHKKTKTSEEWISRIKQATIYLQSDFIHFLIAILYNKSRILTAARTDQLITNSDAITKEETDSNSEIGALIQQHPDHSFIFLLRMMTVSFYIALNSKTSFSIEQAHDPQTNDSRHFKPFIVSLKKYNNTFGLVNTLHTHTMTNPKASLVTFLTHGPTLLQEARLIGAITETQYSAAISNAELQEFINDNPSEIFHYLFLITGDALEFTNSFILPSESQQPRHLYSIPEDTEPEDVSGNPDTDD